ncbi:chemotaxis protein CheR [Thermosipho affectus]|uniref:protein-glutamate O-methyltransferase n=1 Tax=Thermosipho affectus TaxID=660294 RepID=A0ABX3IJ87_9BACT|nr:MULTISPECIES: protein-glutamate O-methyltransferase CheR [Thermosipho]ANQ53913.1 chemotaxis protein CheR [Thermosipho sp. 1070]APT72359.1 chemotaxis protein CheR [Thermosipho sp. 1063]ONN27264.1 chemotaxis protein CheR [Thermosipho affectus]OOC43603.1 chemotaxis protein CheR [Thermosipho sp. 1074]
MSLEDFKKRRESLLSGSKFGDTQEFSMEEFQWFLEQVKKQFNFDLTGYKPHRVKRRIEMLIKKYRLKSYKDYYNLILKDEKKKEEFFDRMTINVTEFFRNPEKWWELRDKFLPQLLKESGTKFKAWSAGCSTGEEPYSLAILLEELRAPSTAKIHATDIDIGVLTKARMGEYEERSFVSTPPQYLKKYFDLTSKGTYKVKDIVKKRILFKRHNLLQDRFETGYDLILCRNVVIYFELETKMELYEKFAKSLRPGGLLFIGNTERIFNYRQLGFEVASPFIYRKL